jgi:hypothetical protein
LLTLLAVISRQAPYQLEAMLPVRIALARRCATYSAMRSGEPSRVEHQYAR